ncbi:MAG TPA: pyridoxamine 5'-phosphate oxidase [Bacteroidetes bacterium]|nr:pyridoxamine 5'-phosphate oxidase [Bacteroidota bacterium]
MELHDLRRNYGRESLEINDLDKNPFKQFENWFNVALKEIKLDPNAMALATSGKDCKPSLRTVLLKFFDESGFVFYTNYSSRKSKQITENPNVSLLFTWLKLERQIIIEGKAVKISKAESFRYFSSRPEGSQLGAWVSPQSSIISSKSILLNKLNEMKQKFKDGKIPLPDFWGGYRVIPERIEFWQGGKNRLHDRFLYEKKETGEWVINRLAP